MDFFDFNGIKITVIVDQLGEPWWIAKEACDVLGLANVARAVKSLDADEKNTITLSNTNRRGYPKRTIINEPGLYHLIAKSTKPEAREFARWIRHEVLPTIRKTGAYHHQIERKDRKQKELFDVNGYLPIFEGPPKDYAEACDHSAALYRAGKKLVTENTSLKGDIKIAEKSLNQATKKVVKMEPKAIAYDQCHEAEGSVCCRDAGKIIGVAPHTLTALIIEHKMGFYINNGRIIMPYQNYVKAGWFEVVDRTPRYTDEKVYPQMRVTPKGVHELWKRFGQKKMGK